MGVFMTDYTKLIAELRNCANGKCYKCSRKDEEFCSTTSEIKKRYLDAADALEAADKRIAELEKSYSWKAIAALEESIEGYKVRIAELESQAAFFDAEKLNYQENIGYRDERIKELETQLPKQGKWISDLPNGLFENVNPWKCSVCGKHYHFREDYCPNCGARMDGKEHNDEQTDC
jgi:uncharacterized coiled-coil protein SlyX